MSFASVRSDESASVSPRVARRPIAADAGRPLARRRGRFAFRARPGDRVNRPARMSHALFKGAQIFVAPCK